MRMVTSFSSWLTAQVSWLGLMVGLHLVCFHWMNRVYSCNGWGHDDSSVNFIMALLLLLLCRGEALANWAHVLWPLLHMNSLCHYCCNLTAHFNMSYDLVDLLERFCLHRKLCRLWLCSSWLQCPISCWLLLKYSTPCTNLSSTFFVRCSWAFNWSSPFVSQNKMLLMH